MNLLLILCILFTQPQSPRKHKVVGEYDGFYTGYKDNTKLLTNYTTNWRFAFAQALFKAKAYEECLELLKQISFRELADPAAYFFDRAICEHQLTKMEDAKKSIKMLANVIDVPERYKALVALMGYDMQQWKKDDLGSIARKMNNVERRLQLAKGGPETQKLQKEVINDLDKIIKQLENPPKDGDGDGQGKDQKEQQGKGKKKDQQNGKDPNSPMDDSRIGKNSGPGKVDPKQLDNLARNWGKLPEKERTKAMQDLTRDMPPKYREVIETYFRKLAQSESHKDK